MDRHPHHWTATLSIALAISLATWVFGARATAGWVTPDRVGTEDPFTIDLAEFQTLHRSGGVFVIDVRAEEQYHAGHIPGALHVSLRSLGARIDDLRARAAGRPLVAYCGCPAEATSLVAARALAERGVPARALVGGYGAWVAGGGAVETAGPR